MPNWYPTKKVVLEFKGETVERVVSADLDRVYLTDRNGHIHVYKDANMQVDGKCLFKPRRSDEFIRNMRDYV